MHYQLIHQGGNKTWAVVLETGDEAHACLLAFAREQHLSAAHLTAIGAFERAVLGYFDWDIRDYRRNPFDEQVEVVSLIGDVALKGAEPVLHMHAVLGRSDGHALGGHLLEGHVRPTLEVIVTESPAHLRRLHDPQSGLALIHLDKELP
ncbi:MAG TPA: PPC domain-containing DNA-binding protein [Frateuria sp.]|uniref:PPC domain-containing DNA-binding protein n=1 Tax=Frateuria sp. TaxID=2211372 RepID=UPI002D803E5A|nr:PPC domain-containing DNA-binding protein [Frateuria sp.]HET6806001.1 PPC domain-containing DNA-binding protein [Frateuria sp.]